jgi:hypothetical protein
MRRSPLVRPAIAETFRSAANRVNAAIRSRGTRSSSSWSVHRFSETMREGLASSGFAPGSIARNSASVDATSPFRMVDHFNPGSSGFTS